MKRLLMGAAISAMFATSAMAQDSGFSLKGFGTLGITHSNSAEAEYVSNPVFQPNGAGKTRQTAFGVDSKIGAQLDWKATSDLSFTVQGLSKYREDKTYSPDIEWAFAKYSVNSNLDVRAGRIRPAIYLLSDFLDVNYANSWVRPPVEFYGSAPISRMEGIDLLWQQNIGDISLLVQPYIGTTSKLDLPAPTDTIQFKNIVGINAVATQGDFTYRVGYIQTKLTYNSPGLAQPFGLLDTIYKLTGDTVARDQAAALSPVDKNASFSSIGIAYDNGEYFASGEYGKRAIDAMLNDGTTYYVSGGMRVGKLTPFVSYSVWKNDSPTAFTGGKFAGTAQLPVSTNGLVTALLMSGAGSSFDQNSLTVGARYDIAKSVALKAQWDLISTDRNNLQDGTGGGLFKGVSTAFGKADNTVKVISAAVDFVF